jgi:hypothetical protein
MRYVATKRSIFYNHTSDIFLGTQNGQYGDGSDLNVVVNTTITLARDQYYNNLTINSSGIINTAGYRIFVAGVLTMRPGAIIQNNGNSGVGVTAGSALLSTVLGGSAQGGNGATFPVVAGTNGSGNTDGHGGAGGAGGGASGGTGGINAINILTTGAFYFGAWPLQIKGSTIAGNVYWFGGAGGGGGEAVTVTGGGGGSGGGIIFVSARAIVASAGSFIRALGGNGGNGNGGAGGGGGGGGVIIVYTAGSPARINWTVDVSGGIGGTGTTPGNNGNAGQSLIIAGNE